jgi:hypothetical protein
MTKSKMLANMIRSTNEDGYYCQIIRNATVSN